MAHCKIIDAVLDLDVSPAATTLVAACTDAVRVFALCGNYLVCQHEVSIKMASKVLFSRTGHVVNIVQGNVVVQIDPLTGLIVGRLTGHNDVIRDIKYLWPSTVRDAYLATVDADGVLYVWDRRGARVMEHVTRSKVSALAPFWLSKSAQPTYVAMAAGGLVKIFDFERGSFAYVGQIKAGAGCEIAIKDLLFDPIKQVFIVSD